MITRRQTKQIYIGNVGIGSDYPISVQSMTNTDTRNIPAMVAQIKELEEAGCEIIRVAVVDKEAAQAIKEIKKSISIPIIADIHFNYELAIESIHSGVDGLRLNPGNIGSEENVRKVVSAAKEKSIPIRIGVNSGSLEKEYAHLPIPEGMVLSAMKHIEILEKLDYDLIKVSLKSSSVVNTIEAYRQLSKKIDYPLHIGITEAGTIKKGLVKSSVGIGILLSEGIGDTIRVSLTENPVHEVYAGYEILKSLELRTKGLTLISCPTCGRCEIDLINLTKEVENRLCGIKTPISVAVMGCVVNGPGEARHADIGIAGGKEQAVIFKKGKILKTVPEEQLLEVLLSEIKSIL